MLTTSVKGIEVPDKHTHKKALRKIPPTLIKNCYGLAVFTSMRSGIAPLGGAGGNGLVVAHNPETGWWSPPASISPNTFSAGLILGVDIYDCVLILNSPKAIESFKTHKVTLGADIAVAAGPWRAGAAMESGKEGVPVFSYVKSRGLYAGVEAVGQVFLSRFDENERVYHWPGVKAGDILTGHVKMPREAKPFIAALEDAASGKAQVREGPPPEDPMFKITPLAAAIELDDGEVLKLPPTPEQTDGHEYESDPETERVIRRMTLPSDFSPPPVEKKWMPALPPPRHGEAMHHPTPRRAGVPAGAPAPALPPRRQPAVDSAPASLHGSPPLPPRRSTEMPPTPTSPGTPIAVAAKPPPLPPRSRNRPPSMAIPPTPVSPTSPAFAAQHSDIPPVSEIDSPELMNVKDVHADEPPSYAAAQEPAKAEAESDDESVYDEVEQHLADEHATVQAMDEMHIAPAAEDEMAPRSSEEMATLAYNEPEPTDSEPKDSEAKEAPREEAEEKTEKTEEKEKADEPQEKAEAAEAKDDKPELPAGFRLREAGNMGFRG